MLRSADYKGVNVVKEDGEDIFRLISGCYVVRREGKGRVLAYMLSERGLEEAARICEEVRGYIDEWTQLLGP